MLTSTLLFTGALTALFPPGTSTAALSLERFLQRALAQSPDLQRAAQSIKLAQTRQQQQLDQASESFELQPEFAGRLFHFNNTGEVQPVAEFGVSGGYRWAQADGSEYALTAHAMLPSTARVFGRSIRYGAQGQFALPLLRNFGGRLFRQGAKAEQARAAAARADLTWQRAQLCAQAWSGFVQTYAAQSKLRAFVRLLGEKRRIWNQTRADFRRGLVTKVDLLAARSDWLQAKAQRPLYEAQLNSAFATLRRWVPQLQTQPASEPPRAPMARMLSDAEHPQARAIDAMLESLRLSKRQVLAQTEPEMKLVFKAKVDRIHDVFDTQGRFSDATEFAGSVGLDMRWPVHAPSFSYEAKVLTVQARQLQEDLRNFTRARTEALGRARALHRGAEAAQKIQLQQLTILRRQINAALSEFRAGKMEYQNYLDHWDRYQRARLAVWDRWSDAALALVGAIPWTGAIPEVCDARLD